MSKEGKAMRTLFAIGLAVMALVLANTAVAKSRTSNPLFSILIPNDLLVETDNTGIIAASGPHGEEGFPFLFVYFCSLSSHKKSVTHCGTQWHPLTIQDIRELNNPTWNGTITTNVLKNGVTEWGACVERTSKDLTAVSCIRRLRSKTGYVDIRYVSDPPQREAEKFVEKLVASVKWR